MAGRIRSPIRWFGGKGKMVAKILPLLPPHKHYVEPFGGGASILLAKKPCGGVETYNDIDEGLVGFFRVLRDPEQAKELQRLAELTPYSRAEYNYCRDTWEQIDDPVKRAWAWWVVARQSFSGRFGASWSSAVTAACSGMAGTCAKFSNAASRLHLVTARLKAVQIECADWRTILERYSGPGYLAYCDPPYVHGTRSDARYEYEMTDQDHKDLVAALLSYDGMVVLSGYANGLYRAFDDAGWERRDFKTACYAAGRTRASGIQGAGAALRMQPRTESIWRNPAAIEAAKDSALFMASVVSEEIAWER